jgi:hypothetical protein
VNLKVKIEMKTLKTIMILIPFIPQLKNLDHFHVIVQALIMSFLCQHYENINHDHNSQMFHILYLIETNIHHASIDVHKFIISLKY